MREEEATGVSTFAEGSAPISTHVLVLLPPSSLDSVEERRSSLRSLELHNAKTASLDYPVAVDDQIEEVKMREELRRGVNELEKRASREVV